jgi:hypothetical protein
MDVSELRKRILRAIDDARHEASERRTVVAEATEAYGAFLTDVAVPLLRQAASVLNATGPAFVVHTPAGSVRLAVENAPETYLEVELDSARTHPEVVGRVSLSRGGRQGQTVEERPIAPGKPVGRLTEEDLSAFLMAEVPKLIVRP